MKRLITLWVCGVAGWCSAAWGAQAAGTSGQAVEKTVAIDGHTRTYLVYAPRKADGPLPLVIALHGGGSNARRMERYSRFNGLAEREGFIVCYPQAIEGNWNDGRGVRFIRAQREDIDDVKFVRRIVQRIGGEHKLDRSRTFATGISNGAFMSHRLAAEASDLIAAVAPVVGGMAPAVAERFNPKCPVSLFVIQGDRDPLVPIKGGYVGLPGGRRRGKLIPTDEAIARYLKRNGVSGKGAVTILEDADPNDGTTTRATVYPAGLGGAKTRVYVVKNGGHAWPGRPLYLPESIIGKASRDFDATRAIWEFFKSCPPRKLDKRTQE